MYKINIFGFGINKNLKLRNIGFLKTLIEVNYFN